LIAKVLVVNNGMAEVEASDEGRLFVQMSSGADLVPGQIYHFIGRANSATTFTEISTMSWDNFSTSPFP
jgi:hypothetical protein